MTTNLLFKTYFWKKIYFEKSEYRDVCVQRRTVGYPSPYYIGDEDCLFMNVLVPETDNTKLLPVLLWVHGGSYKETEIKSSLNIWRILHFLFIIRVLSFFPNFFL
jgi:acetyl esterase/lipase